MSNTRTVGYCLFDLLKFCCYCDSFRTEAAVRRVETSHKEYINVIQKDILRLLRALTHFRDQVALGMEKEGHPEAASQLLALPKLIPDNLGTDAKEILSHMTGNVVEYLHNIECILIHTFMSIRIMNKFTGSGGGAHDGAVRQIMDRVQKIKIAKKETTGTANRLKGNKKNLEEKKEDFQADQNESKYNSLLNRYKIVWNMFLQMTKEMDILEGDFEETLEETAEKLEPLLISELRVQSKKRPNFRRGGDFAKMKTQNLESEKTPEKFRYVISMDIKRKNMKLLDRALEERRIPFELYEKAKTCLTEGLQVPIHCFQALVTKYIALKAYQESEDRSKKLLGGDIYLPTVKRPVLLRLLKRRKKRLADELKKQSEKRDIVKEQTNVIHKEIWTICNDLLVRAGVNLIQPKVIDIDVKLPNVQKPIGKKLMNNQIRRSHAMLSWELPPLIHGNTISLRNKQMSPVHTKLPPITPMVTTPLIVSLDVNKERIQAKKTLTKREPRIVREPRVVPLSKSRSYNLTQDWRIRYINEML